MTPTTRTSLLAAAATTLALTLAACSSTSRAQPTDTADTRQAAGLAVCHDAVKQQLKTSATPTFSEEKFEGEPYGFKFTGTVDSGASAKSSYVCSANQNGANWIAAQVVVTPS
ncbi:hypothetical protein ACQPYK_35890 [Streptosporangium sp. CA-135522]|uniref:hypothetical protein n=1 Tax=Streptosporangium sp. CA-135522 TaxID=3240072 RepID=UPI003D946F5C